MGFEGGLTEARNQRSEPSARNIPELSGPGPLLGSQAWCVQEGGSCGWHEVGSLSEASGLTLHCWLSLPFQDG